MTLEVRVPQLPESVADATLVLVAVMLMRPRYSPLPLNWKFVCSRLVALVRFLFEANTTR